ncbi:uncharacterized protein PAC_17250 [Phialocephala subalpina]|uniref:Uncharacterized protein n=1 Tax=Phialocephala subalpina TaxID=576137 RepID=A0A1L7XQM0_9HELO|nr:uncharacterized protein PAC_17250 [Phialocephala subalpina]
MARSRTAASRSGINNFFKSSKSSGVTKTKKSIYRPTAIEHTKTLGSKAAKTGDHELITFPNLTKTVSASDKDNSEDVSSRSSISPPANIAVYPASQAPAQNTYSESLNTLLQSIDTPPAPTMSIDSSGNAIINNLRSTTDMTNTEIRELTLELYKHFDYAYHEIREALDVALNNKRKVITKQDLVEVRDRQKARLILRHMDEAIYEAQDAELGVAMSMQWMGIDMLEGYGEEEDTEN